MQLYDRAVQALEVLIQQAVPYDEEEHGQASASVGESSPTTNILADALDHLPAGLAVFDHNLRMIYCNAVLKEMLDYPKELFSYGAPSMEQIFLFNAARGEYGSVNIEEFVASKMELARTRQPHTYERRRPNGNVLEVRGVPLDSGGFVTIYLNVSPEKAISHAPSAEDFGDIDKLTGLPTAKSLERHIADCQRALKPGEKCCVMTIDLARFSKVNAQHGRVVGDFVLREVAIRLSSGVRGTDYLARTGGDRFSIVHPVVLRPSDPARLIGRLISAIKYPIICGSSYVEVSARVGFTLVDHTDRDINQIMTRSRQSLVRERGGSEEAA